MISAISGAFQRHCFGPVNDRHRGDTADFRDVLNEQAATITRSLTAGAFSAAPSEPWLQPGFHKEVRRPGQETARSCGP